MSGSAGVWFVQEFLNSVDAGSGRDELSDLPTFHAWLAARADPATGQGRLDLAAHLAAANPTESDLDLARRLRERLRAEATAHHTRDADHDPAALHALAAELPILAHWPRLVPAQRGARGVLTEVLIDLVTAPADWARLKICPADDCRWAYHDTSKNSSRRWCSMEICGNRSKTKAYRRRQAEHAPATD